MESGGNSDMEEVIGHSKQKRRLVIFDDDDDDDEVDTANDFDGDQPQSDQARVGDDGQASGDVHVDDDDQEDDVEKNGDVITGEKNTETEEESDDQADEESDHQADDCHVLGQKSSVDEADVLLNCVRDKKGVVRSHGRSTQRPSNDLTAIRAASSRLLRESRLNLPSHVPPTLNLEQFLNRKKGNNIHEELKKRCEILASDNEQEDADEETVNEIVDTSAPAKEDILVLSQPVSETTKPVPEEAIKPDDLKSEEASFKPTSLVDRREASKTLLPLVLTEKQSTESSTVGTSAAVESSSSSLRLVFEPDSIELTDSSDFIDSSQKDRVSKFFSKLNLPSTIVRENKPRLASKSELLEGDSEALVIDDGPHRLIERALKHTIRNKKKCNKEAKALNKAPLVVFEDEQNNDLGVGDETKCSVKREVDKMMLRVRLEGPGTKHSKLKQSLKERMRVERIEERKKQRELEYIDNEEDSNEEDEEEEGIHSNDESEDIDNEQIEETQKMGEVDGNVGVKLFVDDEAAEADDEDDEEVEIQVAKDKYHERKDVMDDSVLEKSDWTPTKSYADDSVGRGDVQELCDEADEFGFDDVVNLCSGRFAGHASHTPTVIMSQQASTQGLIEHNASQSVSESQKKERVHEDNEDTPDETFVETPYLVANEEDDEFLTNDIGTKKRKRIVRLFESDDEEEDGESISSTIRISKEHDDEIEDAEEKQDRNSDNDDNDDDDDKAINQGRKNFSQALASDVDYDSEENEISREENKKSFPGFISKKRIREEYLEREAELSGSEAASSDEEENEMDDDYENEEGDNDEDIDDDQVLRQLERIRNKQILDSDRREVRLLQEAFLEDGELHSDHNRKRVFRWKNVDDAEAEGANDNNNDDDGEDDIYKEDGNDNQDKNDVSTLSLQKLPESDDDNDDNCEDAHFDDSQFFSMASKLMRRINNTVDKNDTSITVKTPTERNGDIFKSPSSSKLLQSMSSGSSRGSFLSRCRSQLEKLAETTKPTSSIKESRMGRTAQRDSARNFVFAAVDDKENNNDQTYKRKQNQDDEDDSNWDSTDVMITTQKAKKARVVDRSIDRNDSSSIFSLLGH